MLELPPEFDAASYRERYPNLARLKRSELRRHWRQHGRPNGCNASPIGHRDELLWYLKPAKALLEIGPFDKPSLEAFNQPDQRIDYADYFSTDEMAKRAQQIPGRDPDRIPKIRYVLSEGGYEQINESYDAVVSHHCVEHQPDLIHHLQQVARILKPGGIYLCTMPDHRRCFDRHLPPSTLIDVLAAHLERRTRPPLQAVIEHRCFTVQNWQEAPNPLQVLHPHLPEMLSRALQEYQSHAYVDVHCWKLTNERFRRLLVQLASLGYLPPGSRWKTYNIGHEFATAITFGHEDQLSSQNPNAS